MGIILFMEDYYKDEISELVEEVHAIFNATFSTTIIIPATSSE